MNVAKLHAQGALTGEDLELARVAGGAPEPLRPLITKLEPGSDGVEAILEGDIPVLFGSGSRATDLRPAVAAVLARLGVLARVEVADTYEDAITVAAVAAEPR